eukprot:GHVR01123410.1.p1 GENE.GHVR01123410.1~~GHVR01123410.1.p1  ORF type:complete len:266 (+),score=78.44 GHVR01123410.1:838-1635(+)
MNDLSALIAWHAQNRKKKKHERERERPPCVLPSERERRQKILERQHKEEQAKIAATQDKLKSLNYTIPTKNPQQDIEEDIFAEAGDFDAATFVAEQSSGVAGDYFKSSAGYSLLGMSGVEASAPHRPATSSRVEDGGAVSLPSRVQRQTCPALKGSYHYAECFPDQSIGISTELYDSDEEEKLFKMEVIGKKGIDRTRNDFKTDEEYTAYVRKRNAIEKAVTRGVIGKKTKGNKSKGSEKQQWTQIEQMLKEKKTKNLDSVMTPK